MGDRVNDAGKIVEKNKKVSLLQEILSQLNEHLQFTFIFTIIISKSIKYLTVHIRPRLHAFSYPGVRIFSNFDFFTPGQPLPRVP